MYVAAWITRDKNAPFSFRPEFPDFFLGREREREDGKNKKFPDRRRRRHRRRRG